MIDFNNIKNVELLEHNFSGMSLVGVDFSGSVLHKCIFDNCDLSHANFENADLYRSSFKRAILYTTKFKETNLTRCDFSEAYIYGMQINGYSNITYCLFNNFRLENKRRRSEKKTENRGLKEYKTGSYIEGNDASRLSSANYYSNGYSFTFEEFDNTEYHMQYSQVYNRLKRLFSSNSFGEEARSSLYWERYHRTRSWYKYHHVTGLPVEKDDFREIFKRILLTGLSYTHEKLAGYGLKPNVVFRNLIYFYLAYFLVIFSLVCLCEDSGILYGMVEINKSNDILSPVTKYTQLAGCDIIKIMYFSLFSMFSLTFQSFSPFGHVVWISSIAAIFGLSFIALFISSFFSWIRLD